MSNINKLILEYKSPLINGFILSRPNRFTLLVEFNFETERVYLPNSGKLSTVLEKGREIPCTKEKAKGRKTRLNAFAVKLNGIYATVNSNFANTIFENVIKKRLLLDFFVSSSHNRVRYMVLILKAMINDPTIIINTRDGNFLQT